MTNKTHVHLYTQPLCGYCDIMKSMLDKSDFQYDTIDISLDVDGKEFIRTEGHKTVPQLYANGFHINKKANTMDYTSAELNTLLTEAMSDETLHDDGWPWQDSGIEQII